MKQRIEAYFQDCTSIKRLREIQQSATLLMGGKIPCTMVRGTFETDNALLFADGAWYRVRNIKTVYCEIFIYDDGGRWIKAAYYSPFDILVKDEA